MPAVAEFFQAVVSPAWTLYPVDLIHSACDATSRNNDLKNESPLLLAAGHRVAYAGQAAPWKVAMRFRCMRWTPRFLQARALFELFHAKDTSHCFYGYNEFGP